MKVLHILYEIFLLISLSSSNMLIKRRRRKKYESVYDWPTEVEVFVLLVVMHTGVGEGWAAKPRGSQHRAVSKVSYVHS